MIAPLTQHRRAGLACETLVSAEFARCHDRIGEGDGVRDLNRDLVTVVNRSRWVH